AGSRLRLAGHEGELTGRVGVDLQRARLRDGGLPAACLLDGAREQARVLPRLGDRLRDVGRDLVRLLAVDQLRGHRALQVRVLDLVADERADAAAPQTVLESLLERLVEV